MRLEAELHMRALARKQKRDLAAQAAVGTGLAASEHGDSSTEHSVRRIGLGGQERSVMDAPKGNPWDALSGGGDTTYASSRRTGRSTPKPAPRPVAPAATETPPRPLEKREIKLPTPPQHTHSRDTHRFYQPHRSSSRPSRARRSPSTSSPRTRLRTSRPRSRTRRASPLINSA